MRNNSDRENKLTISAQVQLSHALDFDIRYRYDKVLFIERNLFIGGNSGKIQSADCERTGFASRSARQLLYDLQQKGLMLFCLHDLDISGITIFESLRKANDKFKFDIDMVDLGITPEDVAQYSITPETVGAVKDTDLEKLSPDLQDFSRAENGHSQRVELNAFTTEQLLDLIACKIRSVSRLPRVNIASVVKGQIKMQVNGQIRM